MSIRKNTLFTVPLFCVAAGLACYYLIVYGVGRFVVAAQPDGTLAADPGRELLLYGLVLAASLVIGQRLFRRMTKKEIAVSATIIVVFRLLTLALDALLAPTDRLAMTFFYLSLPGEWHALVPMLLYRLTGSFGLSAVLGAFSPYLLVLFGRKQE